MLDEVSQQRVGEPLFVCPLGVTKNTVECFRICLLDTAHRFMERLPQIGSYSSNVLPTASFRYLEPEVLSELRIFLVPAGFFYGVLIFLFMHVRDSLEEEKREDVGLEVRCIHRPAQDIGCLPKMRLKFRECERSATCCIGTTSIFTDATVADFMRYQPIPST